jgi:hypothetical protein
MWGRSVVGANANLLTTRRTGDNALPGTALTQFEFRNTRRTLNDLAHDFPLDSPLMGSLQPLFCRFKAPHAIENAQIRDSATAVSLPSRESDLAERFDCAEIPNTYSRSNEKSRDSVPSPL